MALAARFRFLPRDIDEMGWRDFLAFVNQIDEDAREHAKAEANRRLNDD